MFLNIVPARLSDYPFMCEAFAQANKEHLEMRPDLYRPVHKAATRTQFNLAVVARLLGHQPVTIQIAEVDGVQAGIVFAESLTRSKLSWSLFEKEACLENVIVLPEFRRQGIGSALVESAIDWAIDTGHTHMNGNILQVNERSKAMFAKLGFTDDKRTVGLFLQPPR